MGSSQYENLTFTALREENQPNVNNCWMRVYDNTKKNYKTLFYAKYIGKDWEETIELLNKKASVIQQFYQSIKRCIKCHKVISVYNTCYFCDENYCDACCPEEISYRHCDICNISVCYRWYRYSDGYCEQNGRRGPGCDSCGN